ncbi:A/G-specific adenine glycosylase [Flavobacterium sp.]|uniref:A/G-specific adenine glycosylase n=1 Tax=Flavobacterium sp. TaxID=239 RepID=UPI0008D689AD|nr:A/G-specific adenine glycosylase [Flavobacterium sp.]OGS61521.1 MAG: A/G-specific adenine glycosylase [Flavobacteria bacterium GWF1_32_7]HBD25369.1 A/G-specific adenine glycosylase [Flavobacterium sp.]
MEFSNSLIHWYLQNKRDLPWRNTTNPYPIWLSEIMLQQTRVAQGLPYFLSFTDAFPTIFDLANADEEQVLKLWQGLGYYSRARNLHATAKHIAFELNGEFPPTYKELLKLKGVGEYTAAAIASFSYNEPVAVLDGNVFRVLSRYFNVDSDISLPKTKTEFQQLAQEVLDKKNPALFNQAIMEFGALQCVPKNPDCNSCVLNSSCAALQHKKVSELPVKTKKTKVTNRYLNYLILKDSDSNYIVQKREGKGIWENLYEFPVLETDFLLSEKDAIDQISKMQFYNQKPSEILILQNEITLHKLSHQHLHIRFFELRFSSKLPDSKPFTAIQKLPFPIVIHNFMVANYCNSL